MIMSSFLEELTSYAFNAFMTEFNINGVSIKYKRYRSASEATHVFEVNGREIIDITQTSNNGGFEYKYRIDSRFTEEFVSANLVKILEFYKQHHIPTDKTEDIEFMNNVTTSLGIKQQDKTTINKDLIKSVFNLLVETVPKDNGVCFKIKDIDIMVKYQAYSETHISTRKHMFKLSVDGVKLFGVTYDSIVLDPASILSEEQITRLLILIQEDFATARASTISKILSAIS